MADHKNFYYTKEHEWVEKITDETVRIGITEHAAEQLGDIVFVDFVADLDAELAKGDEVGHCRIRKIRLGSVCACLRNSDKQNEALADAPETVNAEAFAGGWMYEMSLSDASELDELLSYDEYEAFVAEEEA